MVAAAGGLFSILTYAVSRRRCEFGVRAALGADPATLRRLIMRDGLATAGVGLAAGAVLTALVGKALESLAFGVTAANPFVWAAVAASWRPAVQAMRADPVTLLREE
jgi:ABC-type lipoprotein release transport system permease subunit